MRICPASLATGAMMCLVSFAIACASRPAVAPSWDDYWQQHGVSPPPPRDFLHHWSEPAQILNLTNGALSDETVRRWVIADLRRSAGDEWAFHHLRLDLANAGVLGPRGLNGTDRAIESELARGTVEIDCGGAPSVHATAAVVAVPWKLRNQNPGSRLTEFVIVFAGHSAEGCKRVLKDGQVEPINRMPASDSERLEWHLDTGDFQEDEVIGDLWYQARGSSCKPRGIGSVNEVCALVRSKG
jgi:hypothetical protein